MIAEINTYLFGAIVTAIASGGVLGSIVAWRKIPAEKQQIVVSAAQGAVVVQSAVIDTLKEENARLLERIEALELLTEPLARSEAKIQDLKNENNVLRARVKHLEMEVARFHALTDKPDDDSNLV
ncbi:MAG TPA: hypothetical protein VNU45_05205 [Rummeliibacillus sp.]|nr:hypothetical protein [Rummeliibacillus sp.]